MPYISFAVEIPDLILFDTLLVHPLTRFTTVKRLLEPSATEAGIDLSDCDFSRDGRERISDSRRLWDMGIISGAVLYLLAELPRWVPRREGEIPITQPVEPLVTR